jgi:hypothetical protein
MDLVESYRCDHSWKYTECFFFLGIHIVVISDSANVNAQRSTRTVITHDYWCFLGRSIWKILCTVDHQVDRNIDIEKHHTVPVETICNAPKLLCISQSMPFHILRQNARARLVHVTVIPKYLTSFSLDADT